MDWVMRKTLQESNTGIRQKIASKPDDLDFADDIALIIIAKQRLHLDKDRQADPGSRKGGIVNHGREIQAATNKFSTK